MNYGICSSCYQEKKIYSKGLCARCYKQDRAEKKNGLCPLCGHERPLNRDGICYRCIQKQKELPQGECKRCGRWLPIKSKGMCNACSTAEHRQRTGYKGPIKNCVVCGEEKPIHSHGMCNRCLTAWRYKQNPEHFRDLKKDWANKNKDKLKEYREKNKERRSADWKKYYENNKERLKVSRRIYAHQNRKCETEKARDRRFRLHGQGYIAGPKIAIDPVDKINSLLKEIPELQRVWVEEFLNSVYKERDPKTKIVFLKNLVRMITYVNENYPKVAKGGWNMISLTIIEECQVNTGVLKDSVRIFFNWLYKRKKTTINLADAIPTQTQRLSKKSLTVQALADLYQRWIGEDGHLVERIAGLLIIFYGFTNHQLRYLQRVDVQESNILFANEVIELEQPLVKYIHEYTDWRRQFYIGIDDTNPYFFVSQESVFSGEPVSIGYFSSLFRQNGLPSPNLIRKSLIMFYKNQIDCDPFILAAIANISPRGAARYWE